MPPVPIFITREVLESVSAGIVLDALLEVANEHGVEVYPRAAPNQLEVDELRVPESESEAE